MLSLVRVIVGPLTAFGGAPPKGEHSEPSPVIGGGIILPFGKCRNTGIRRVENP